MRKNTSPWQSFIRHVKRIKLVDRCLILFMFILMVQSTYNLFANELHSEETNSIDIIVRTTSAGIFGYLLSPNFFRKKTVTVESSSTHSTTTRGIKPVASLEQPTNRLESTKIGFVASDGNDSGLEENTVSLISRPVEDSREGQQQIIIATTIGIFSLIVLMIARNCALTPAMISTTSQMRDFVSGCVGFLLGSPGSDLEQ